jgi:hypothetical protein
VLKHVFVREFRPPIGSRLVLVLALLFFSSRHGDKT